MSSGTRVPYLLPPPQKKVSGDRGFLSWWLSFPKTQGLEPFAWGTPHPDCLSVFGNGNGHARKIYLAAMFNE